MTLHQAIQEILINASTPLTSREIAAEVNASSLYRRKDNKEVTSSQVSARIAQYPELFEVNERNQIQITEKSLLIYRRESFYIHDYLRAEGVDRETARLFVNTLLFIAWTSRASEIDNFNSKNFTLSDIPRNLPDEFRNFEESKIIISTFNNIREHTAFNVLTSFRIMAHAEKPDQEIFGTFFNYWINQYSSTDNVSFAESSTPKVLAKFVGAIYDIQYGDKIFDPFAGFGSSLIETYKNNIAANPVVVANDINQASYFQGKMNLYASDVKRQYYYLKNSFTDWNNSINADLIVTVPPFNLRIESSHFHYNDIYQHTYHDIGISYNGRNIDGNVATVGLCISHLNNNGKAVIVIPDNLLFSSKNNTYALRQYLVKQRLLAGVISLPAGMFKPFMNISCSVLLIDKDVQNNRRIFIYDASGYTIDEFGKHFQSIIDAFNERIYIDEGGRWIDYIEISKDNYDLTPKKILAEDFSHESYVKIKNLASTVNTGIGVAKSNLNREEGIPYIQIGDLNETEGLNEIDNSVATSFVSDTEDLPKKLNYIPDNAVLIAKVGSKLKPSIYRRNGDAICNPHIIVINVDPLKILPEYLITQLQSDYVLRQIDAIRHNIGVPHYSKADFLNVKISILPLDEQRKFVTSFYGKKLQQEQSEIEQKREDDLYNIIANLKHELKQPVSSLGLDLKTFRKFLSEKVETGQPLTWQDPITPLLPGETIENAKETMLENALNRMMSAIADAQKTLTKAEEILNIGSGTFAPETVQIKNFLTGAIIPVFSNANCTINVIGNEHVLSVDKYQIEVLFKRLIENAIKHGFKKDSDKANNIINIRLAGKTAKGDFNEIIVENNGIPFPEGFDIYKFETSGLTSNRHRGTGFGGYHIKRIIESHKGEIHIADMTEIGETQFKVRFKIYLP